MAENKKAPAFQFYPQDFLVGTADMSAEEVGGYIRLMCYQWSKGGVPNDNKKLMQLSGIFDIESLVNVKSKFILFDDGLLKNKRLENTREEQNLYKEKQAEIAKKGWEERKRKSEEAKNLSEASHRLPIANPMPEIMGSQCSSTSSSTSSTTIPKTTTSINIDERKLKFASTLEPYLEKFGKNLLNDFYKYWTEPNKSNTKFKQELEKTWSLERRLETWASNDKNFNRSSKDQNQDSKFVKSMKNALSAQEILQQEYLDSLNNPDNE